MAYNRYFKRQGRMVRRGLRKRYVKKTRSGRKYYNIGQIMKDVNYVKRSLNVEHKQCSTVYGVKTTSDDPTIIFSPLSGTATPYLVPTDTSPIIKQLAMPGQGTMNMNRIGNSIKLTHISARIRALAFLENYHTSGARLVTPSCTIMMGFFKPAVGMASFTDIDISDIFEKDAGGDYTRSSYRNKNKYGQFYFPRGMTKKIYLNPSGIENHGNTTSGIESVVERFINFNVRCNVKVPFVTGDAGVTSGSSNWASTETMRPFIVVMSNCKGNGSNGQTYVNVVGEWKFSYVDN